MKKLFKKYWKFTTIYTSVISVVVFVNILQDPTFKILPVFIGSVLLYTWIVAATSFPHKFGLK